MPGRSIPLLRDTGKGLRCRHPRGLSRGAENEIRIPRDLPSSFPGILYSLWDQTIHPVSWHSSTETSSVPAQGTRRAREAQLPSAEAAAPGSHRRPGDRRQCCGAVNGV